MAAYASTVTLDQRKPFRLGANPGLAMISGTVDVTNYNTTLAEITDITGLFKTLHAVILNSASDNGYLGHWVDASNAVKAYKFDYDAIADGAAIEADVDTDIGAFHFVAFGTI